MIDATVLFLTFTDQHDWGFSGKNGIQLNCSTDVDDNWYGPLCQTFSRVVRYDLYKNANRVGIAAVNRELVEAAEIYRPQYVIYPCNFSNIVTVETLEALRKRGARVVAYFFDDEILFEAHTQWILPHVDFSVTHARSKVDAYRRRGARVILSNPLPHNPATYCKVPSAIKRYDATFLGFLAHGRENRLTALRNLGAPVTDLGWNSFSRKLPRAGMVRIFNESKVNLNFSSNTNAYPAPVLQIKGRVFEAALCGGFMLTEYAPGLEDYFEIGREIDSFRTVEEAAEKIRFYLDHPVEREAIALRGHERAQREYTAQAVFQKVFATIDSHAAFERKSPPTAPPAALSPLQEEESEAYYRWAKALIGGPDVLRKEWYETARMAVSANPKHEKARRILRRADRWGDPEPLKHTLQCTSRRILGLLTTLATRFNRKAHNVRHRLGRKWCHLRTHQAFRRHAAHPMPMKRFVELWKLAQSYEGGRDTLLGLTPASALIGPGGRESRWAKLLDGAPLTDMALAPAAIEALEREVRRLRPDAVLEFGSGFSSVVLAMIMQEIHPHSHPRVFSIEQDASYLAQTRSLLERHRLDHMVRLLHAPLAGCSTDGCATECYDLSPELVLPFLGGVRPGLVLIDGPAGDLGCRYGTLPALRPFVRNGAVFYLDDAFRDGEVRTLQAWIEHRWVDGLGILWVGKGLATGRIIGPAGGA